MIKEDVFSKTGAVIVPWTWSGRHEGRRRAADQTFCGQCDGGISDGQERTPGTAGTECAGEGTASERVPGEFSVAEQSISEELKDIVYRE